MRIENPIGISRTPLGHVHILICLVYCDILFMVLITFWLVKLIRSQSSPLGGGVGWGMGVQKVVCVGQVRMVSFPKIQQELEK